jgi:hypothetical protein
MALAASLAELRLESEAWSSHSDKKARASCIAVSLSHLR